MTAPTPAADPRRPPDIPAGVSVVVPVYNSEQSLGPLVDQLSALFTARGTPYEVLLVNDGSRDRSWEVVRELAAKHPHVRGFDLMRNFGQHNALLCGIRAARYDTIVTMDDDLQHPPEEVPALLAKLEAGYDVVYGTPDAERHGFLRNIASVLTKKVWAGLLGAETARVISAFRAVRTTCREAFDHFRGPFVSVDVLLAWATTRIASVRVQRRPRTVGRSNYTFRKLLVHTINITTAFSSLPLRLASILGFTFTGMGVIVMGYVIARYLLEGGSVPGFPFLASVVAIFSGVQLFALGVIGEYLGRVFLRGLEKPLYVIREETWERRPAGRPPPQGVRLELLRADHADAMYRWMCDPEVRGNVGVRADPDLEYTRQWVTRSTADDTVRAFAIYSADTHVGNVILDKIDRPLGTARLSIYVGEPAARSTGVGRAAVMLAVREAFDRLGLNKVWLTVHAENLAAIRAYRAAGFSHEGTLRDEFLLNGRRMAAHYYGLTRADWGARGGA